MFISQRSRLPPHTAQACARRSSDSTCLLHPDEQPPIMCPIVPCLQCLESVFCLFVSAGHPEQAMYSFTEAVAVLSCLPPHALRSALARLCQLSDLEAGTCPDGSPRLAVARLDVTCDRAPASCLPIFSTSFLPCQGLCQASTRQARYVPKCPQLSSIFLHSLPKPSNFPPLHLLVFLSSRL